MCTIECKIAVDLGIHQIDHTIRTEAAVEGGFAADTSQAQAQGRVSTWIRELSCGAVQLALNLRAIEINLARTLRLFRQTSSVAFAGSFDDFLYAASIAASSGWPIFSSPHATSPRAAAWTTRHSVRVSSPNFSRASFSSVRVGDSCGAGCASSRDAAARSIGTTAIRICVLYDDACGLIDLPPYGRTEVSAPEQPTPRRRMTASNRPSLSR